MRRIIKLAAHQKPADVIGGLFVLWEGWREMLYRVTPKTSGNRVNIRKGMTGKGYAEIVATVPGGTIIEGKLSKNGEWVKVDGGYIRAELMQEIADE